MGFLFMYLIFIFRYFEIMEELRRRLIEHGVDPDTRIMYVSNSKDAKPGKGVNELIGPNSTMDIETLSGIKNFRRYLSNFSPHYVEVRMSNDRRMRFANVEALFQYAKFDVNGLGDRPELLPLLDPNITGLEARKMRKAIQLTPYQLQVWAEEQSDILFRALLFKFYNHEIPRKVLLATGSAHIIHSIGRGGGVHGQVNKRTNRIVDQSQWELMAVRDQLNQYTM